MTLQQWLSSPNKNYSEGVALYKQHKGTDQNYNYFIQASNPPTNSPHFIMLIRKLQRVARIAGQYKPEPKEPVQPAIKMQKTPPKSPKDIKVKPVNLDMYTKKGGTQVDVANLRTNTKYVNKILALKWTDLQPRDKEVFFNSQQYFKSKQELLFSVSKNEQKIKGLHAALKTDIPKQKKVEILSQANTLEKEKVKIFEQIDSFQEPENIDPVVAAKKEGVEKTKRIVLLQGYIRRNKNALVDSKKKYSSGVRKKKEAKLKAWEDELKALENEIK